MDKKIGAFPKGSTMKKIKDRDMAANSRFGYISKRLVARCWFLVSRNQWIDSHGKSAEDRSDI